MHGPHALRFLLATFAGWMNREQAQIIDYQAEVIRILQEQLGHKRPRLTDYQRRRLAAKSKPLGRRLLDKVSAIVTPDTIMRWHRRLIAEHHTYPHKKRVGRPGLMKAIRELIVPMATDNSSWGYLRIRGELKKGRAQVVQASARTTRTQSPHSPTPSPSRQPTSRQASNPGIPPEIPPTSQTAPTQGPPARR